MLSSSTGYWGGVFPALVVMGLGLGLTLVPLSSIALIGVEDTDAGVASAMVQATQQVGGATGFFAGALVVIVVATRSRRTRPGQQVGVG